MRAVRSVVIVEAFPGSQLLPEIDVVAIGEGAADEVACFAGSRPSFARLAQSARREAARACEPGLVLQIR